MSEQYEHHDINRRLTRLEDADSEMSSTLTKLLINTETMNNTLQQLVDIEPRVRKLEQTSINNSLIVNAVKWLAITAGGSAIVMSMTYLFSRIA
jgi:ribosomal protein L17